MILLEFTKEKKKEKICLQNKIDNLKFNLENKIINQDEYVNELIKKFNSNFEINREILTELVDRIEIDKTKKIFIYFKFKLIWIKKIILENTKTK